eukprot:11311-Heterococcus_DN1.PRE.1
MIYAKVKTQQHRSAAQIKQPCSCLLGAAVVGLAVHGAAVVGLAVVGAAVHGAAVVGAAVVGLAVVGAAVVGVAVVGDAVGFPARGSKRTHRHARVLIS